MFAGPVLALTTDQDSAMFGAHCLLAYNEGLRVCWFPDCNHQESNADAAVLAASGFSNLEAKITFLARFNHGPYSGGRWLGQQREACEVL